MGVSEVLSSKIKEISQKYDLEVFILFGSRATTKYGQFSDWDFAFYSKKPRTVDTELEIQEKLMSVLKTEKIDLININRNHSVKLRNQIFQKGIPIYEKKKGIFSNLKWRAWIDYKDFEKYLVRRSELLNKKINQLKA